MSQATDPSPPRPRWIGPAIWGVIAVFVSVAAWRLFPVWAALARGAAGGRLHLPDADLFASQPLALQLHILALSLAAPLGVVMMVSRKGRTFHRVAGWTWVGLVLVGAVTPVWLGLASGRWGPIHLLVIWVSLLLIAALRAARRHRPQLHGALMMWNFFGSILFAGALTFSPGRLMWRLFFG